MRLKMHLQLQLLIVPTREGKLKIVDAYADIMSIQIENLTHQAGLLYVLGNVYMNIQHYKIEYAFLGRFKPGSLEGNNNQYTS